MDTKTEFETFNNLANSAYKAGKLAGIREVIKWVEQHNANKFIDNYLLVRKDEWLNWKQGIQQRRNNA